MKPSKNPKVMTQKLAIILLAGFVSLLSGCDNGPDVTVCVVNAETVGLDCIDKEDKEVFIPLKEADRFLAFSPDDALLLIEHCGLRN